MSAAVALREAVARLTSAGIPDPARDARLLLAYALGIAPDRLTLHLHDPVSPEAAARFQTALRARVSRQPVSQIIGRRAFWGRVFIVTPDVLDPRPETETLIAAALSAPFTHVLDLGTGSGAIALTLLAERPSATGMAVDLSPKALSVARANAEALGVADRLTWHCGDWFDGVAGPFDLIVSNPPYIAAEDLPQLSPEVRLHEPLMALSPGGDGLDAYRQICAGAGARMSPNARILLEIGPTQGAAVQDMLTQAGFANPHCLPDLDGRDRIVAAVWPG